MPVDAALIDAVRAGLRARADGGRAPGMQAYMRSAMPYHGVPTPGVRAVCKEAFAAHPLPDFDDWRDTALAMWRDAAFREERYAAVELTGHRLYRRHQTLASLPIFEEMIVDGAWWDYVDAIAIHRVGPLLATFPGKMAPTMRRWSRSPDLWKRRSSIICQVARKGETDLELLYDCIAANWSDRDFFIRKAIGWALRSYAWTDPDEVARYVAHHENELSPLSRREALKNV